MQPESAIAASRPRVAGQRSPARRPREQLRTASGRNPFVWGLLVTLGAGLGVLILTSLATLSTVLVYVGVALFLSLALEPLIMWATHRGLRRSVAVVLALVAVLLVIVAVVAFVVPVVQEQIALLVEALPGWGNDFLAQQWVQQINVDDLVGDGIAFITDGANVLSLGGGLLSVGTGIVNGVSAVVAVGILTIYFTASLPTMLKSLYRVVPLSRREGFSGLADEVFLSVGRYVGGQVSLALLNAAVVLLVVSIAGAPVPSLLALLAFIGALIPVVGTVASFIVIAAATLTVSPVAAIVVGLILLAYAQVEAYILTPRVMSRAVAIPGVLVVLAAFGGAALGGVLGALVAVPVTAAGVLIFERVVVPAQQRR